jgi:hypothetical protein
MFIFTIGQVLWSCEPMGHIMGHDHSLGLKEILN